jgi:uncharacterized membrane protein
MSNLIRKSINGVNSLEEIKGNESVKEYGARINGLVANYEGHILSNLEKEYKKRTTRGDKVADKVAAFGGSWKFIFIFGVFLVLWMLTNTLAISKAIHFDEPPFILLNLILSFIAAFQAPIIMMSQNRQSARDKQESVIDFSINYKAEQEIDDMQGHLHRIESDFANFRNEVREELEEIKKLLQK